MKLKNRTLAPPPPKPVAIPRAEGDIILHVQAILDYSDFDRLCPFPKPPVETHIKTGKVTHDTKDPAYQRRLQNYATKKFAWINIKSLEATEGLEWDNVNLDDPDTWENFQAELESAFTPGEIDLIAQAVADINRPTEEAQKDALARFMLSQEEGEEGYTSPTDEQSSTPFLEPVNGLG